MKLIHEFKTLTEKQRKDATVICGMISVVVCVGIYGIVNLKKHKIDTIKDLTKTMAETGKAFDVRL